MGSSRRSTGVRASTAHAIRSFWRIPLESPSPRVSRLSVRSNRSSSRSARAGQELSTLQLRATKTRCSQTVSIS